MTSSNRDAIDRSRIKAVIFDMDGVVVDSEPVHEKSLMATTLELGHPMTVAEAKSLKGSTEKTAAELIQRLTGTQLSVEEIVKKRLDMVRELFPQVNLIEGALEFIETCRKKGWALALATSAQRDIQQLIFNTFNLAPYFPAVITGSDVVRGKPDAEPYLKAVGLLGLSPEDCLVIEDAKLGVKSGKAAGCQVVGITTSFSGDQLSEAGADLVVNSFPELAEYLLGKG